MSFIFIVIGLYLTYKIAKAIFVKLDKGIEKATGSVVTGVGNLVGKGITSVTSSVARNLIKRPMSAAGSKGLDLAKGVGKKALDGSSDLTKGALGTVKERAKEKLGDAYDVNMRPVVDDLKGKVDKLRRETNETIDKAKDKLVDSVASTVTYPLVKSLELFGKILENKGVSTNTLFEKKRDKPIEFKENPSNLDTLEGLLGYRLDELIAVTKGKNIEVDVNGKLKSFDKEKMKNIDNDELNKLAGFIIGTIKEKQNEAKINGKGFTEKDVIIQIPELLPETIEQETARLEKEALKIEQEKELQEQKLIKERENARRIQLEKEARERQLQLRQEAKERQLFLEKKAIIEKERQLAENLWKEGQKTAAMIQAEYDKKRLSHMESLDQKKKELDTMNKSIIEFMKFGQGIELDSFRGKEFDNELKKKEIEYQKMKKQYEVDSRMVLPSYSTKVEDSDSKMKQFWKKVERQEMKVQELEKKYDINNLEQKIIAKQTASIENMIKAVSQITTSDVDSKLLNFNSLIVDKLQNSSKIASVNGQVSLDSNTVNTLINSFKSIKLKSDDVNSSSRIMSEMMIQKLDTIGQLISTGNQQMNLEKQQLLNLLSVSNDKLGNMMGQVVASTNVNTQATINTQNKINSLS